MSRSKNIVFLGFLPGFGGAEKSMIMIANGLAELGNRVTIISLKDNNVVYDISEKVQYIFIADHGKGKIRKQINRFFDLKKTLSKVKPDMVISFWLQPAIYAAILSKSIGFKTIYSERGDPSDTEYSGLLGVLRKFSFNMIDGFVFQTLGAKQCFPESIQTKSTIINNPVYVKYDDYEIPLVRRKTIVNVGRLHEQKNQKLLINAFAKISSIFPDYTLEIYGDGELKEVLLEQITQLNLENKVFLKGTTKHIFNEIVDSSLFILSSDYEGMPNALMEAMALGIPSISTDCKPGGARELIEHNVNGWITQRQSTEDLAERIEDVLKNPMEAEKSALKAKDICYTHSVETIFSLWNQYVMKLIDGAFIDEGKGNKNA